MLSLNCTKLSFLSTISIVFLSIFSPAEGCVARHAATGQLVQVREISGPSMFWAHAAWDMYGQPTITYGPIYYQLPPIMKRFTSLHECAHLALPTVNEFEANCAALRTMKMQGLTFEEESYIAQFHQQIGIIGPQYGGTGAAYWEGTLAVCH